MQAHSVNGAVKHVDEVMGSTMIDYEIAAITETRIMDVFEHHTGKKETVESSQSTSSNYIKRTYNYV